MFGELKFFVILQPENVNGIADLAQLAERKLPKLQVAGSSPVIRSRCRKLSSVGSERLPYKQEVAGSNPAVSTKKGLQLESFFLWKLFHYFSSRYLSALRHTFYNIHSLIQLLYVFSVDALSVDVVYFNDIDDFLVVDF